MDHRLAFLGDPGDSCGGGAVEGHGAEVPGKFIKSNRFVAFETTEKPCLCDCRRHTFYIDPVIYLSVCLVYLMILSGLWILLLSV